MKLRASLFVIGCWTLASAGANAQSLSVSLEGGTGQKTKIDGETVFKQHCAECHEPAVDRAPPKESLKVRWPDEIVTALTTGIMKVNGVDKGLTDAEIDAVATYLVGTRPTRAIPTQIDPPRCEPTKTAFNMKGPSWNGWSTDATNHRYQSVPGLSVSDIPRLQVKWSFAYIGGRYGQPTIVGGRLFTSSSSGKVFSLDAKTGCMHWRFDSPTGVRTTVVVGKNKKARSGYAAYFGNYDKVYYAVDAASGAKLWEHKIEEFRRNVLTGAPVLYKNLLIAPVSAWEESGTAVASYECCRARGSVVAMNVKTGEIVWKTYMLPEAMPWKKNSAGTQMYGPAGASIWSAPTVDAKRKLVYVATGDVYVDVPEEGSDSIVALDLKTGAIRWKNQLTDGDAYLAGCPKVKNDKSPPNCPEKNGPDSDFGASTFVMKGQGKDVLIAGQKSAEVYALNPDSGELVWKTSIGKGSALGGVQWGMATDGKTIYAANADIAGGKPGIHALDPTTGRSLWYTAAPKVKCAWQLANVTGGTLCINGNSQAPSAIPGAIFAGTIDGHFRAYDASNGAIIWDVDTAAAKYDTVNGFKQMSGGSLDAAGATVADGMVYVMSGYIGVLGGVLENVLVAYSVDGK
jgi:polyvinyl alcohol dehydrogenase (cytochrome)